MSTCSVRRLNGFRAVGRGLHSPGSFCAIRFLSAAVVLLAFVTVGRAQLGTTEIEVIPPHPTTENPIVLILSGTWKDSCVPQEPNVTILGSQITITTFNPSEMCLMVLTPWQLTVPIGKVSSSGWYSVIVVRNGQPIGGREFEVHPAVDGGVLGYPLLPGIPGTTDADGRFFAPLPWPGAVASGRLLDAKGQPLANRPFSLRLIPKGPALASPSDIGEFELTVPGFLAARITHFSVFSLFGLTSLLLGDIPLEEAELPWSANRPLTWDDFKGHPPEGAEEGDEAAKIAMGLGYSFKVRTWKEGGKWKAHLTEVTTTNTMKRSESWVVPGEKTPALLNHEQKHFDLNEVYRRLLDAALQKLVCNLEATGDTEEEAKANLEKKLDEALAPFRKKCEEVQEQYDRETDHGRNAEKQAEWDKRIAGWLADPKTAPQPQGAKFEKLGGTARKGGF